MGKEEGGGKGNGITEMKMLKWLCGLTRKGGVRNEKLRGFLHVVPIADKLSETG